MLKVGDGFIVKKEGPWKQNDATRVAGMIGVVLKREPRTDPLWSLSYDYLARFSDGGISFEWWVAKEDIISIVRETPKVLKTALPITAEDRKNIPIISGVLDYFTSALAEVAKVSKAGNDQHNPGQPLHWARRKSSDHADCIGRHLSERGTVDTDGQRHSAKLAWRALALLQEELEAEGAPISRGSSYDEEKK